MSDPTREQPTREPPTGGQPTGGQPTREQLDSYGPPAPSADLVDRIMAAVEEEQARPAARPRKPDARRWVLAAGLAAAALGALLLWRAYRGGEPAQGWQVVGAATSRQELALGTRAVAVVHPGASLRWRAAGDDAVAVEQGQGVVVYSVNKGGPFVVDVPGGHVRVVGTRFKVEVRPMSRGNRRYKGAAIGAAALAVAIVTVYQGRVLLDNGAGEVALAAGEEGSLRPERPPRKHAVTSSTHSPAGKRWARRFASQRARRDLLRLIRAARARKPDPQRAGSAATPPQPGSAAAAPGQAPAGQAAPKAPQGHLPKEYIQSTIKEAIPLVKECFELALHERPNLGGKMIVKFTIAGEEEAGGGLVELVDIEGQDPVARHPTLKECIRETIYSLEFPKPEGGGSVKVSYPFILRSSAPGAGK